MLVTARPTTQEVKSLRIAIVEDNATARTNLRSHLMAIENFEIASYSNGNELRNGLRLNNFDLIIMDFHLGQSKNGVEWIQHLQERGLFKPSTGLLFITSDSMPQTIGQILDLHPDAILIKPYTIKSLRTNIAHYLKLRREILPVLHYMDQNNNYQALNLIQRKFETLSNKRFSNDYLKLKGRLLLAEKQYDQAIILYSNVLKKSSNVLWAHWGLIKSEYFIGNWQQCQKMLNHLISESVTKDKAYEWLASVAIGKEEYQEAEVLLANIKENDLSMQATRLKVLSYTMQNKHELAQLLLEKKIQSNLTVKDRMGEYSLELARFHIKMAESMITGEHNKQNATKSPLNVEQLKQEKLSTARKLIGKVGRTANDRQGDLQKNYMLALAYLVEGDILRAEQIIEQSESNNIIPGTNATAMIDSVKIWFGIGQAEKAKEILQECDDLLLHHDNHIERLVCTELIDDIEESYQLQKERALYTNDKGMALYVTNEYNQALVCFNKAYRMYPGIPAFALNLLQCMADLAQYEFQGLLAENVYKELKDVTLSEKNQVRLKHIKIKFGF